MSVKPWQKWMTAGIILMIVGMFASAWLLWDTLPDRIPAHYNALGEPDRYDGKGTVLVLPCVSVVLSAVFWFVIGHPKTWNMPNGKTEAHYALTRATLYWIWFLLVCAFCATYICEVCAGGLSLWCMPIAPAAVFVPLILYIVRSRRIPHA